MILFVLLTLCFYGLPLVLGTKGIWLATPLTEVLTLVLIGGIYWRDRKRSLR